MADEASPLILDACCAINLAASGSFIEIVGAQGVPVAVADLVLEREVRTLTLGPLVEAGHLDVVGLEPGPETDTFVSLALRLDDGEAMSAACAIHRRGALATDDRKAIRILSQAAPELAIRRTSDLLRTWVQVANPPDVAVRDVLQRNEQDASFVPPTTDPNAEWWRNRRT